jgi:hypothetical protein
MHIGLRTRVFETVEIKAAFNSDTTDTLQYEVTTPQLWLIETDTRFMGSCPVIIRAFDAERINRSQYQLDIGFDFEAIQWKDGHKPAGLGSRTCHNAIVSIQSNPVGHEYATVHAPSRTLDKTHSLYLL